MKIGRLPLRAQQPLRVFLTLLAPAMLASTSSVGRGATLPPPSLTAPGSSAAPGSVLTTLTPTFQWQSVAGADGYGLFISRYNGSTYDLIFNSTTIGGPLTGTSYPLPAGYLADGGQYRWNMATHNAAGYGTPSAARLYFSIKLPGAPLSLVVTSPSGGENWTAGTTQTISWMTAGSTANLAYYKIALSTDGGASYSTDLSPNGLFSPSAQTWSWIIASSLNTSQAQIPAANKSRLKTAAQRLVSFYTETAQPNKAAHWKRTLADMPKP